MATQVSVRRQCLDQPLERKLLVLDRGEHRAEERSPLGSRNSLQPLAQGAGKGLAQAGAAQAGHRGPRTVGWQLERGRDPSKLSAPVVQLTVELLAAER